jgi:hypothetical protein
LRDAGLLTKMNCDFSGSYDARAKDKEAQLAEARKTNAALREALAALEKKNELSKADAHRSPQPDLGDQSQRE